MLNSIGLQNIGVTALVRDFAPVYETWRVPVVVSIMGFTVGEYAEVAARLEGAAGFSGIELNLSCPNTERGGIEFGQDPDAAADVVRRVMRATTLPVIAKLTPNVADPTIVAKAVVDAGAHALCVGNTLVGMSMDRRRGRPEIAATFAGLSGPALKPVALRQVYQVAGAVERAGDRLRRHLDRRGRDRLLAGRRERGAGGHCDLRQPAGAAAGAGRHRALLLRARRQQRQRACRSGSREDGGRRPVNPVRTGMGLFVDVAGSAMWAAAGFFIVARVISPAAGAVLALGIFLSALTIMLTARFQESRARALLSGVCPRCSSFLRQAHSHRRWDTERQRWLAPLTAWECAGCGYGHEEPAPCNSCPESA